jgi:predicted enzyme related to lactoylglutathione lyase
MKQINRPKINRINLVVDCPDAGVLADFYSKLLGWEWTHPQANGWAAITAPDGSVIAFQEVEGYEPPVWPHTPGTQGQMLHLDFWVDDLEEGVRFALECGAKVAPEQFFTTSKTMIDPAGHPFCIDTEGEEPE